MTKKNVFRLVLCILSFLLAAAMVVAGIVVSKLDDNKGLTAEQKLNLVLSKTGTAMETNNKNLVNSFNTVVDQRKAQADAENPGGGQSQGVTSRANRVGAYMQTSEEELFASCLSEINYFAGYYCFSEYFNEFLDISFLNNTYFVNQTIYSGDYYAKFVLHDNSFQLLLDRKPNATSTDVETLDITVFFNENYNPTKMEFYSKYANPDYSEPYFYAHHAIIDFDNASFTYYNNSFPIDVTYEQMAGATDEFLVENLRSAEYYNINFNDVKTLDGLYIWDIEDSDWGTTINADMQAKILAKYKEANYMDFTTYSADNFDHENAKTYEKGNECINYAFNKYIVEQDSNGEYLIARQAKGIDKNIMMGVDSFADMLLGKLELPTLFNDLDYSITSTLTNNEEVNFKKELNSINPINTQTIADVKDWFDNKYDSNKYYFELVEFGDYKLSIENSAISIVKTGTNSAEVLRIQAYSDNNANVYYYNMSETGTVAFNYSVSKNANSWWYTDYNAETQEWDKHLEYYTCYSTEYAKTDFTYSNYMNNYYQQNKSFECDVDYHIDEVASISYSYYVHSEDATNTDVRYSYRDDLNGTLIYFYSNNDSEFGKSHTVYEADDYMYINYWAFEDALESVGFTYNA